MGDKAKIGQNVCIELRLQADQLAFISSVDGGEGQGHHGSLADARRVLVRHGVTESGIEKAINLIEYSMTPILRILPGCTHLKVSGSELESLFHLLPTTSGTVVPIEWVARLYNDLVGYAAGSPIVWRHTSSADDVALGLIVLREAMQHGGFRSVSLSCCSG